MQSAYTNLALKELKIEKVYAQNGAKYLAGSATDVWGTMPGISLHTELSLLQRIGLTPAQVLATSTSNFSDAFILKSKASSYVPFTGIIVAPYITI